MQYAFNRLAAIDYSETTGIKEGANHRMSTLSPKSLYAKTGTMLQGLIFVASLAYLCIYMGEMTVVKSLGLSTLTLAIILGMIFGNTFYANLSHYVETGVVFAKSYLLKAGIVLYGFHLTFSQISQVGVNSVLADMFMVASTFGLSYFLGRKWFQLDPKTCLLIGAGNSICGAAAILATQPVIKAGTDKVAVSVAVVVIFGTLALFLYPLMYHLTIWPLTDKQWGLYIGSSIHEVAQVYAAGKAINPVVADIAVTTKMIRVMILAPFLIGLSLWLNRNTQASTQTNASATITDKHRLKMPWFAILFIIIAGINSLGWLPITLLKAVLYFDNVLLTMAMVALGLTTHISAIQRAGVKPIMLGAIMLLWLVVAGAILQLVLARF